MRNRTTSPSRLRRLAAAVTVVAAAAAFSAVGTSAAHADGPDDGWVRIAHLSPDTKSVDVKLTALAGGDLVSELDNVAYGAVSEYIGVPQGTYVVSMVPSGSPDSATPMIQQSVNIVSGQPVTVAAYGKNADLDTTVFADDLTPPSEGQTRVRVIQASTTAKSVDISTTTGLAITRGAAQGTATGYASVPSGPWTLDVTSDAKTSTSEIDLSAGSVATLFVLDNASGGVTVKPVIDSASVGELPEGGIQTGGGGTAAVHSNGASPQVGSDASGNTGSVVGIGMLVALPVIAGLVLAILRRQTVTR